MTAEVQRHGFDREPPLHQLVWSRLNLTVVGVLFVFVYLYLVSVACVILPWLSVSVPGMLNLLALTATTSTALGCYFACMVIDPGRVPSGWSPDMEEHGAAVQEVKKKGGAPRFCKKCNHYKPPRSHHCRVCSCCVLRMDHHCPWVNNCIGHRNYRCFFHLIVFASLALVHSTLLLVGHAIHIVQSSKATRVIRVGPSGTPHSLEGPDSEALLLHVGLQTFAVAISLPASVAIVMLLVFHLQMIACNKTTIEHAEGVTAQIKSGVVGQQRQRHPYDLGIAGNLHDVLGDDAAMWCVPTCRPVPGGLSYKTVFDQRMHDYFSF